MYTSDLCEYTVYSGPVVMTEYNHTCKPGYGNHTAWHACIIHVSYHWHACSNFLACSLRMCRGMGLFTAVLTLWISHPELKVLRETMYIEALAHIGSNKYKEVKKKICSILSSLHIFRPMGFLRG